MTNIEETSVKISSGVLEELKERYPDKSYNEIFEELVKFKARFYREEDVRFALEQLTHLKKDYPELNSIQELSNIFCEVVGSAKKQDAKT